MTIHSSKTTAVKIFPSAARLSFPTRAISNAWLYSLLWSTSCLSEADVFLMILVHGILHLWRDKDCVSLDHLVVVWAFQVLEWWCVDFRHLLLIQNCHSVREFLHHFPKKILDLHFPAPSFLRGLIATSWPQHSEAIDSQVFVWFQIQWDQRIRQQHSEACWVHLYQWHQLP